jgi:hypothetical protein
MAHAGEPIARAEPIILGRSAMKLNTCHEASVALVAMVMAGALASAVAQVPEILPDPDNRPPNMAKPVKVYFLSGQSNMCGMGRQESLRPLPAADEKFGYLVDDQGNWTVRNDVHHIYYVMDDRKIDAPLTVHDRIGPELGIGHVLGTYHDEMVLLIKAACGNRSLGYDFRPPSARKRIGEDDNGKGWYAGISYDRYVGHGKAVMADIANNLPGYKGQGFELAGIFWWQGHKDRGMPKDQYEELLAELIRDMRKDFNAPNAKFVVATVAFNGHNLGPWQGVWEAQMGISQRPEFAGNVASVDIRDIGGGGFHYGDNGATYAKVGDRMGRAMAGLLGKGGSSRSSRARSGGAEAPMPAGLDADQASRRLRPMVQSLSQRKYAAVMRVADRLDKSIQQQKNAPNADTEALDAELKDIATIRKFIDEQAEAVVAEIKGHMKSGNVYRAHHVTLESGRYFRGIEAYDKPVAAVQKELTKADHRTAIRQGAQFYRLLANAQRVRNDRTVQMLTDFAAQSGDSVYAKAAKAGGRRPGQGSRGVARRRCTGRGAVNVCRGRSPERLRGETAGQQPRQRRQALWWPARRAATMAAFAAWPWSEWR